jgi:hypothetical protein
MNITKEKVDEAITLKGWYSKKLAEVCQNDDSLGLDYQRNPEDTRKVVRAFTRG